MSAQNLPTPWGRPMPEAQFKLMRRILAAPSPVGLEAAMTCGVLRPQFESFMPEGWALRQFQGHAGMVVDTHPGDTQLFRLMIVGHADKIRLQVRSIGDDGKVWLNSDGFLPATLIGHEVRLFSENPARPGHYRVIDGGTVEALGAIHFAEPELRSGEKGVKREQLYLELQIHGEDRKAQVERLGVRPGDTLLLHRPIRRGFGPDTFYGAYLDNGLGSFVTTEAARLLAEAAEPRHIRVLFAIASHEEIGCFGSRVLAAHYRPDALIAVDVEHDYVAAPGLAERRPQPLEMGKGFSLAVGSVVSEQLNQVLVEAARALGIPVQRDVVGTDTGTDGMAGVLASVDCAAASVGIPIRNMHTISETGHTADVLAALHGVVAAARLLDERGADPEALRHRFRERHPRLDRADPVAHPGRP